MLPGVEHERVVADDPVPRTPEAVHGGVEAELGEADEHLQPEDGEHEHALGPHRVVMVDGFGQELDLAVVAEARAHVVEVCVLMERDREHVVAAGHATSPIVKGGSDIAQKAYLERTGVDARAYVLMAYNQVKPEAWGMFKYPNWSKVEPLLRDLYNDMRSQKLAVDAFTEQAARLINEQLPPQKK